jgi:hypothetical protein
VSHPFLQVEKEVAAYDEVPISFSDPPVKTDEAAVPLAAL